MKIVSLEAYITELICYFGLADSLVGISEDSRYIEGLDGLPVLTVSRDGKIGGDSRLQDCLNKELVLVDSLKGLNPDLILTALPVEKDKEAKERQVLSEQLNSLLGPDVTPKLYSHAPTTLEEVFSMFEALAKQLGCEAKGKALAQRIKAQVMNWSDNFYDRMKSKRVSFIAGIDPLQLGGLWIPDMIKMASAVSQLSMAGKAYETVSWKDILEFNPDVILVAPQGMNVEDSMRSFKYFEKQQAWEDILAVKRGQVYFTGGDRLFHQPSHSLMESMGILVSVIAGFDSGYITERNSFYQLRWLEMQRHRFE